MDIPISFTSSRSSNLNRVKWPLNASLVFLVSWDIAQKTSMISIKIETVKTSNITSDFTNFILISILLISFFFFKSKKGYLKMILLNFMLSDFSKSGRE